MNRRTFLQKASAAAAAATVSSRISAQSTRPPNVLFIMADQWRRPAFGYRGEDPVKTPVLDALSKQSMVFTRAYCGSPLCIPSRGCLITGQYPQTSGIIGRTPIKESQNTIAHEFKRAGYTTGYIGKWHLAGPQPRKPVTPEFRGGFEYWMGNNCSHDNFQMHHTDTAGNPVSRRGYVPDMETDYAIDYIKANKAKPFLLVVSWAPPHPGTLPPPPGFTGDQLVDGDNGFYAAPKVFTDMYKDAKLTRPNVKTISPTGHDARVMSVPDVPPAAGYFGAIASLDLNVAKLLKTLDEQGLTENTIVVFTSDHGEMMTSQGLFGKKVWWEESVGIPLMVRWPGKIAPGHYDGLFNNPDTMPTLVSLAGFKPAAVTEGTDFSPALRGKSMPGHAEAYTAMFNEQQTGATAEGWRGVVTMKYSYAVASPKSGPNGKGKGRGKLATAAPEPVASGPVTRYLFDMEADPYQMHPLDTADANPVAADLRVKLKTWLTAHRDPFAELV
jgi:arylsulfatase A-like enzyme